VFRDKSLMPGEAIRLAALGFLSEAPQRYGDLALAIRRFVAAVAEPSVDLMGTSLELLRLEGLVAADGGEDARLRITPQGMSLLHELLEARLRAPFGDLNRLNLLLKLRFLHLLPDAERQAQLALIAQSLDGERRRLDALRQEHAAAPPLFLDWIGQDIAMLEARLAGLAANGGSDGGQGV
jgi:DNA-binding PadR family transcriptional regulator